MVPSVKDCDTWGTVFAAVYTTTHGTPSLAVLPEVLKQVQSEHGVRPALELGMKLLGNFETVSAIILSNIRCKASALIVQQSLAAIPAVYRELPRIIAETYNTVGRDTLGVKALKPSVKSNGEGSSVNKDKSALEADKKKQQ